MKKCLLFLVIVYSTSLIALSAQPHVIDSLRRVLKSAKNDSDRVDALNGLSDKFNVIGNNDSSLICAIAAKELAEKINYVPGIAGGLGNMAIVYEVQGDYSKALDCDLKTLEMRKKQHNKKGIATSLGSMGNVYMEEGNYPKSLECFFNSLSVFREINDKNGVANNIGSIAIVYYYQHNLPKALEYNLDALGKFRELGNKGGVDYCLANIGIVYDEQHNYAKSLEYYFKSLTMSIEMGDKIGAANVLGNIGNVYKAQKDFGTALEYYNKALALQKEIGDKSDMVGNFNGIGSVYAMEKEYKKAGAYFDSSLAISKSIKSNEALKNTYSHMAVLDSATSNYKAGLEDYKKYITYNDSLLNEANTKKTVQAEMNFEFEQKQATAKAEQDKKDAIAEQERNKQKVIRDSFIAGFALMLALAFFIFRGYRQKQKANEVITQQKEEVEKQKALVEQQKTIVEQKNKDILDSINYAKRLQDAILPPMSIIKQYLPESFVIYKPKDIVAGDFYWMERVTSLNLSQGRDFERSQPDMPSPLGEGKDEVILIAAADCTGHGVPGALVSVVCSNALNRAVKEFGITEPGKILDKVRELVLETFEKSEDNVQDGMDISLCAIKILKEQDGAILKQVQNDLVGPEPSHPELVSGSQTTVCIEWAGANNPLWYIQNNELKEIAPDKQPIGKYYNAKPFTTHSFTLNRPEADREAATLYLFTDGYADQFGGEKGKKFKYKQFQEKLVAISHLPMAEQKDILDKAFGEWKGNLEQVDDVLVIGIRV